MYYSLYSFGSFDSSRGSDSWEARCLHHSGAEQVKSAEDEVLAAIANHEKGVDFIR